jgi:hypothetical protein
LSKTFRNISERKDDSVSQRIPAAQGTFVRGGEYWTVGYGNVTFALRDLKGLSYIQHLLQYPGEEFRALDLIRVDGAAADACSADLGSLLHDPAVSIGGLGDSGEMLDSTAIQNYKGGFPNSRKNSTIFANEALMGRPRRLKPKSSF